MSNATLDKDTPTKAPGTARMTISKTTSTFAGMALGPLEGSQKVRYVCDAEKMAKITHRAIPGGKHHTRHAKFNRKGTPRWVPVSNATLDKDTLTKAPDNARMTISKSTVTFFGMVVWPPKGLKKSVM